MFAFLTFAEYRQPAKSVLTVKLLPEHIFPAATASINSRWAATPAWRPVSAFG